MGTSIAELYVILSCCTYVYIYSVRFYYYYYNYCCRGPQGRIAVLANCATLYKRQVIRDMTSDTMRNFLFCHRAGLFNAEASRETSLRLATECCADKTFISPGTHLSDRGRIKTMKSQLYQTCNMLLRQSKILYLQ